MQLPDVLGQFRPLLSLVGSIVIIAGLLDVAGFVNVPGAGLETALCGFLAKNI